MTTSRAADMAIKVARCVRCSRPVWAYKEMGMLWLIDPTPVPQAVLRSRRDPYTDPPLITVTDRGTAGAYVPGTPRKAFALHTHQSGATIIERQRKPQPFWDDALPPPF